MGSESGGTEEGRPTVSVIVCTRDRADSCRSTVACLLEIMPAYCELLVVDQSGDGSTRQALSTLTGFESVVYLPSDARGSSAARNAGTVAATGELLLYTDDDCLPDPGWIEAWLTCFATEPETDLAFGQVNSPPFDPSKGYTPTFDARNGSHGAELFRRGAGLVGMGANMAMRRRVWEAVGGFDEGLGAGTRFPSAEETDIAYRACKAGYRIRHLAAASVQHFGYRPGQHASRLMRGYVAGIAAMYAKHARCGDLEAVRLICVETGHHVANVAFHVVSRTRPIGLGGLLFYLGGIGSAMTASIDRQRRLYSSMDLARVH